MTPSFQTLAAIRYGYGLSPVISPPGSVAEMLAALSEPDQMAATYPIKSFDIRAEQERNLRELRAQRRKNKTGADKAFKTANKMALNELGHEFRLSVMRPMLAKDAFRERLLRFWSDHFSVTARGKGLRYTTISYIEEAIRPNMTGSFATLLRNAVTHPVMMVYLDQIQSIGPNSKIGKKVKRGLNENLAREILELHTLGVHGTYSQDDVRQFAELLTGLYYSFKTGFTFRAPAAEPGAEQVLGKSYGGGRAKLDDIYAFLDDLAVHPDTARHIASKLVVHFVTDTPDPAHVAHVAAAFRDSNGDLMATYAALLDHPAAWQGFGMKAKQPFDFIVSSLRAMNVEAAEIETLSIRETQLYLSAPMQVMGQPYLEAAGPDGWPEPVEDWITPQGLAARIQWAIVVTNALGRRTNPVDFARTALAEMADQQLLAAVGNAENRAEGMALVLASPQFNRR